MPDTPWPTGRDRLAQPVLPLVRLVQLLFLTGPFSTIREVVAELNEPIETIVHYPNPALALEPYLDLLAEFEKLKEPGPLSYTVCDEAGEPLSAMEAIDLWVAQQVVTRELETINSLLCGPCHCALCCVGPDAGLQQEFFEIPLTAAEASLFPLPRVDSLAARQASSGSEPPFEVAGQPFYANGPALYCWRTGWSLILPRQTACPHLTTNQACAIYPDRPEVCRRPQVFAYLIERLPGIDEADTVPAFQRQNKILAIWDCPYVKELQGEIAAYAELCELEPIFKENKR